MIKLFSSFFGFIGGISKQERDAIRYENERNNTAFVQSSFPSLSTRKQVGISKPRAKRVINPARSGLGRPNRSGRDNG